MSDKLVPQAAQFKERSPKPTYQRGLGLLNWGQENVYPNILKDLAENSPTAQTAWELNSSFIFGRGFENGDELILDDKTGFTLNDLVECSSRDVSLLKTFAVHVDYNEEYKPIRHKVFPADWVRVGNQDDNGFNATYKVCRDWVHSSNSQFFDITGDWRRGDGLDNSIRTFFAYDPDPTVVKYQVAYSAGLLKKGEDATKIKDEDIVKAGGFSKYTGQVFFVHMDQPKTYAVSGVHSARNSMDTEANNEESRNARAKRGYASKWIFVKQAEEDASDSVLDSKYRTVGTKTKDQILKFSSREAKGNVLYLETAYEEQPLDEVLKTEEIKPNVNVQALKYDDERSEKVIRNGFDNPPDQLLDSGKASMFATSDKALQQYRDFYNDQTSKKRRFLQRWWNKLLIDAGYESRKIIPLYQMRDNGGTNNEE